MTAALFLAKNKIPVILIDKESFPRDKVCGDCLGGYAISILKQLGAGILDRFIEFDKKLVGRGVHFFGPKHQKISIDALNKVDHKISEVALCRRLYFDQFLMEEVKKHDEIKLFLNTEIKHIEKIQDGLSLSIDGRIPLKTKLLILSTGSTHHLVHKLVKRRPNRSMTAAGIRTYFEGVKDLNQDGFIELHFLKELAPGYLWIFPLPGNLANVGLGIRSDVVARKKLNLRKLFQEYIYGDAYFRKRFDKAKQITPVEGFPLALGGKREVLSGDHYLLSGDAGNLIEPLFGEGIGNAMYSGKFAADHAIQCLKNGSYSGIYNLQYDRMVYNKLGTALRFSAMMQKIASHPKLMSILFDRVSKNHELQKILSGIINGSIPRSKRNGMKLIFRFLLG